MDIKIDPQIAPLVQVLALVGRHLAANRISAEFTQAELAERAGISLPTVKRAEAGGSMTLENLLKLLRATNHMHELASLFEEAAPSPLAIFSSPKVKTRRRVRKKRSPDSIARKQGGEVPFAVADAEAVKRKYLNGEDEKR